MRFTTLFACAVMVVAGTGSFSQEKTSPPVHVTVKDEQAVITEPVLPVDPQRRINYQPSGLCVAVRTETNQTLHLSHFATVNVDGRLHQEGQGGKIEVQNQMLKSEKGATQREGFYSVYSFGDVRITATVTVVPTKPADKATKRRRDAVVVHYLIENKGNQPHKVGIRIYMDTFVVDNDGCQFAAPTMPGKVLNGVELRDKTLPPYVQLLQRPDLKAPGFVAHLTLDMGSRLEKPERVVLTQHGTGLGTWDMPAIVAGDTALGIFWQPKEVKPGGKREFAYGYGQGLASSPESEGRVQLALGGSFEPGKLFNVSAYVTDPTPGQHLTLELPTGMALVDGKECQPVPTPPGDEPVSLVQWQARVERPGQYTVRVRSSTGVTQGKIISVTAAK